MWSLDAFESLNPAESGQAVSFLHHLLSISATSEHSLSRAAAHLDALDGPYVMAFAQLPYSLDVPDRAFTVNGWREGVVVDLAFERVAGAFAHDGSLRIADARSTGASVLPDGLTRLEFTQVMATIRLWGPRTQLHEAYRNCLTRTGLRNDVIGRVEGWMDAPEARMSLPARRYAPLTAQAFQAEVARRMRTELLWALQTFLRAYSVANLESIATDDLLYGYFVMIAPGRVACASPPLPIAAGLCAMGATVPFPGPDPEVLLALLERNIAFDDRFLVQLMAMHRLLKQGEPKLALIGCVTAIEWFLNDRLAASVQRMRGGKEMKASVTLCLRSGALNFLPERQRDELLKLALRRNAIVHGPPPVRTGQRAGPARTATATSPDDVRSSLFLALELYRTVNLRSEAA